MTDKDVERVKEALDWLVYEEVEGRDAWLDDLARVACAAYESAVSERVRDAVIKAYIAGATDVHEHWQEDSDPDFTEAAHDYASAALTSTDTVTDIAKLGTVSLTSIDGHCVRIDFPSREDAERMYAVLTKGSE
jgi:hypothetical protein